MIINILFLLWVGAFSCDRFADALEFGEFLDGQQTIHFCPDFALFVIPEKLVPQDGIVVGLYGAVEFGEMEGIAGWDGIT